MKNEKMIEIAIESEACIWMEAIENVSKKFPDSSSYLLAVMLEQANVRERVKREICKLKQKEK